MGKKTAYRRYICQILRMKGSRKRRRQPIVTEKDQGHRPKASRGHRRPVPKNSRRHRLQVTVTAAPRAHPRPVPAMGQGMVLRGTARRATEDRDMVPKGTVRRVPEGRVTVPRGTVRKAPVIVGILSLLLCCCGGFGVILGAVGVVLAILSRGREPMENTAKIGLGLSIGGIVLGIVVLIMAFAMVGSDEFRSEMYRNGYGTHEDYSHYFDHGGM